MARYNLESEFAKISGAFRKVKQDMTNIFETLVKNNKRLDEHENVIRRLHHDIEMMKLKLELKGDLDEKHIVGNTASKKFHYDNCPFAKNIKEDHRKLFTGGIEEAVKNGYNECSCVREA